MLISYIPYITYKLHVRCSRVCLTDERENDWHDQNGRGQARGRGRGKGRGRGAGRGLAGGSRPKSGAQTSLMGMRFLEYKWMVYRHN